MVTVWFSLSDQLLRNAWRKENTSKEISLVVGSLLYIASVGAGKYVTKTSPAWLPAAFIAMRLFDKNRYVRGRDTRS
jgi:hypothetical protein